MIRTDGEWPRVLGGRGDGIWIGLFVSEKCTPGKLFTISRNSLILGGILPATHQSIRNIENKICLIEQALSGVGSVEVPRGYPSGKEEGKWGQVGL